MKKNLKLIISVICVSISIIICAVMIHFSNENFVEDVFLGSDIEDTVDDYLINQGYIKPPEADTGVWLIENEDTYFEAESEELATALKKIKKSIFNVVFIRSNYFSLKDEKADYGESLKNLKRISEDLKEQGKKVYVEMCLDFEEAVFAEVSSFCDGILLKDSENLNVEKLNLRLLKVAHYIEKADEKTKTYINLSFELDISKLNKKATDGVSVTIDESTDISQLNIWDKTLKMAGSELICTADIDGKDNMAPIKSFYEAGQCESISVLCLSSYKGVTEKKESFDAIKNYIENGIVPDIAFRELSITGFEGGTVETNEFTTEIEICGSNLFPAYLNGEKLDLGETGSKKLTFNLNEGENIFTFKQCGKEITYKVNMTFDGDIIRTVMPGETVTVQPKEKLTVMVIAYSGADITVKVGTKEYQAKCDTSAETGYTAFTAKITMPETREEVSSLGMISVIGTVGERTVQQKGAMIVCGEEMTTTEALPQNETTTAIQLGNFVEELISDKYEYTTKAPAATIPITSTAPIYEAFAGNTMCIVTEPYADTRPLVYNDDTYVPSYSTLVQGTMDYVTAQSTAYNSDENETVYFYELSSGRKVKSDHVQLVTGAKAVNSLNVISSQSENGTLTLRLQTNWKVPYAITHTPQNYFSAYGSKYNLSSFNANYIQIVFYHTASVSGKVDTSGSNVVSSASWTVSESENKVSLMMPLHSLGKYYGTSIAYDENGYMVITVHNNPQTLKGAVILLDPGHGGDDPGALGIGEQVKESDVNIAVAYAARNALEAKGATVYLTRQGNETLSLDDRKNIAYSLKPDLYVSIHSNGSESSSEIGTAVYYYKSFSQPLASNIYNEMIGVFKNNLYYGQQELYDDLSDGARYYPFSVTRLEDCPSVLIETGFMTNDNECYKLIQSSTHTLFGQAIADGIEKTISV